MNKQDKYQEIRTELKQTIEEEINLLSKFVYFFSPEKNEIFRQIIDTVRRNLDHGIQRPGEIEVIDKLRKIHLQVSQVLESCEKARESIDYFLPDKYSYVRYQLAIKFLEIRRITLARTERAIQD